MNSNGIYWNAYKEIFEFHRNNVKEKSWDKIRDGAAELEKKYQETEVAEFMNGILVQVLLELERAGQQ